VSKQRRLSALALALVAGLLVIPAGAAISDDPEPISGAIEPGVISDTPDPISGSINDNPDPFRSLAIDDGPDPISGILCEAFAVSIVDGPEPVDRTLVYSDCVESIIALVGQ